VDLVGFGGAAFSFSVESVRKEASHEMMTHQRSEPLSFFLSWVASTQLNLTFYLTFATK